PLSKSAIDRTDDALAGKVPRLVPVLPVLALETVVLGLKIRRRPIDQHLSLNLDARVERLEQRHFPCRHCDGLLVQLVTMHDCFDVSQHLRRPPQLPSRIIDPASASFTHGLSRVTSTAWPAGTVAMVE